MAPLTTNGQRLADVIRGLPRAVRQAVSAVQVRPGFPLALATISIHLYADDRYDVAVRGDKATVTPRPRGPRRASEEPPIKAVLFSRHDDIAIPISGSDLWGQCLQVLHERILGTAEAAERTVTGGPAEYLGEVSYVIVGHGKPGSVERAEWVASLVAERTYRPGKVGSRAATIFGRLGGRAGRGAAKRRDVDYAALGRKGAEARRKGK